MFDILNLRFRPVVFAGKALTMNEEEARYFESLGLLVKSKGRKDAYLVTKHARKIAQELPTSQKTWARVRQDFRHTSVAFSWMEALSSAE